MTISELVELEIAEAIENDSLEEMLEFYMYRALELDVELLASLIEARSAARKEYLNDLAEDYGVPESTVYALASILGPSEDYDGLVSALEDIEGS